MRGYLAGLLAVSTLAFLLWGCGGETPPPSTADETLRVKERCADVGRKVLKLKDAPAKTAQMAEIDSIIKLYGEVKLETANPNALMGEIPAASIKKMDAKLDEIEERIKAVTNKP